MNGLIVANVFDRIPSLFHSLRLRKLMKRPVTMYLVFPLLGVILLQCDPGKPSTSFVIVISKCLKRYFTTEGRKSSNSRASRRVRGVLSRDANLRSVLECQSDRRKETDAFCSAIKSLK